MRRLAFCMTSSTALEEPERAEILAFLTLLRAKECMVVPETTVSTLPS